MRLNTGELQKSSSSLAETGCAFCTHTYPAQKLNSSGGMLASLRTAPALGSGDLPESTRCQRRFQPQRSFWTPSLTLPGKNNPAGDREQACGSTAFLPPSTNPPLPRAHAAPGEDALVQEAEVPGSPLAPAWLEQNHPDPHGEISTQPSAIKGNAAFGFAQCERWVKQSDSAEECPPRNPLAHITSDPCGMKSPVLTVEQDFAQQLRETSAPCNELDQEVTSSFTRSPKRTAPSANTGGRLVPDLQGRSRGNFRRE